MFELLWVKSKCAMILSLLEQMIFNSCRSAWCVQYGYRKKGKGLCWSAALNLSLHMNIYRRLGCVLFRNRFVSWGRAYTLSGWLVYSGNPIQKALPSFSLFPSWAPNFRFPFGRDAFCFSLPPPCEILSKFSWTCRHICIEVYVHVYIYIFKYLCVCVVVLYELRSLPSTFATSNFANL